MFSQLYILPLLALLLHAIITPELEERKRKHRVAVIEAKIDELDYAAREIKAWYGNQARTYIETRVEKLEVRDLKRFRALGRKLVNISRELCDVMVNIEELKKFGNFLYETSPYFRRNAYLTIISLMRRTAKRLEWVWRELAFTQAEISYFRVIKYEW